MNADDKLDELSLGLSNVINASDSERHEVFRKCFTDDIMSLSSLSSFNFKRDSNGNVDEFSELFESDYQMLRDLYLGLIEHVTNELTMLENNPISMIETAIGSKNLDASKTVKINLVIELSKAITTLHDSYNKTIGATPAKGNDKKGKSSISGRAL